MSEAGDPTKVDILEACRADRRLLQHMFHWTAGTSDLQGCIRLSAPKLLQPRLPLGSPRMPVLVLLQELESRGYMAAESRIVHEPGKEDLRYDARRLSQQRFYFQCLLGIEDLGRKGLLTLPSGKSQAAYVLCLRSKNLQDFDWTAKDHVKQAKDLADELALVPSLAGSAAEQQALLGPEAPEAFLAIAADSDVEAEEEAALAIAGDSAEDAPEEPAEASEDSASTSDSTSASSSSSSVSSDDEAPAAGAAAGPGPPAITIRSQPVEHKDNRGRPGLVLKCTHHAGCSRFRTIGLWDDLHGADSAQWYLATWLRLGAFCDAAEHRSLRCPSKKDVTDFKAGASSYA